MFIDIIAATLAIELMLACFAAAQPNHRWVPQRKVRLACPTATANSIAREHYEKQTLGRPRFVKGVDLH